MPGPHGAMLTLVLEGGDARALQVLRRLEVAIEATSLGGVESLASVPFNSSHFNMTPQERLDAEIPPGYQQPGRRSGRLHGQIRAMGAYWRLVLRGRCNSEPAVTVRDPAAASGRLIW